jgi:toxin CptA
MLRVTLKPSRFLAAVLVAAHAAAAVTLLPLALPAWVKLLIALCIAGSLCHALWRHAWLRSAVSVTAIELHEGGAAGVEMRDGGCREARVLRTTYVSAALCVVNLQIPGAVFARHAIVVSDNVDAESFRRLRVWLRWACRSKD